MIEARNDQIGSGAPVKQEVCAKSLSSLCLVSVKSLSNLCEVSVKSSVKSLSSLCQASVCLCQSVPVNLCQSRSMGGIACACAPTESPLTQAILSLNNNLTLSTIATSSHQDAADDRV